MEIERAPELEQLVDEAFAATERGDVAWLTEHTSPHDPIMLGSAPDEEMHGMQVITDAVSTEVAAHESWPFKVGDRRVLDARRCGDVGWTVTEARWEFDDESYVPVRGVTIFHREDGTWKSVVRVVAPAVSNDLLRAGSPIAQPAATPASA